MRIFENALDHLPPLRRGGLALYPAQQLGKILAWAAAQGKCLEWIEAIAVGANGTQPSMAHSLQADAFAEYTQFSAACLNMASDWAIAARARDMEAYFEIGISD